MHFDKLQQTNRKGKYPWLSYSLYKSPQFSVDESDSCVLIGKPAHISSSCEPECWIELSDVGSLVPGVAQAWRNCCGPDTNSLHVMSYHSLFPSPSSWWLKTWKACQLLPTLLIQCICRVYVSLTQRYAGAAKFLWGWIATSAWLQSGILQMTDILAIAVLTGCFDVHGEGASTECLLPERSPSRPCFAVPFACGPHSRYLIIFKFICFCSFPLWSQCSAFF